MEIKVFKNYQEMSEGVAKLIINQVINNPQSTLGLATGSTPIGLYQQLIKDHVENGTSYKNVRTFNLDEYIGLSKDHNQSYFYFMKEQLFNHIDISLDNVFIPDGGTHDVEAECDAYNQKLSQSPIDIQILGIGTNGHIGFNEPGTPFDSVTQKVELVEGTRKDNARFFDSMDEVPTHAISMGIKNILDANVVILLASGKNKADAIKTMVEAKPHVDCPASALQNHPHVIVYVDEEAASKLSK